MAAFEVAAVIAIFELNGSNQPTADSQELTFDLRQRPARAVGLQQIVMRATLQYSRAYHVLPPLILEGRSSQCFLLGRSRMPFAQTDECSS